MPRVPVFTWLRWRAMRLGGMRSLTRNISLSRSLRVSTCLGVNCASGDTKLTLAGTVEHNSCGRPDRYAHGLFGGEINLHVDFGQVDDRQHLSARRNDFPGVDETIQ